MRRGPGGGAGVGLAAGVVVVGLVILLPATLQDGGFYEIGDPLVFMGLPILIVTTGVGALIGTLIGARGRNPDRD